MEFLTTRVPNMLTKVQINQIIESPKVLCYFGRYGDIEICPRGHHIFSKLFSILLLSMFLRAKLKKRSD